MTDFREWSKITDPALLSAFQEGATGTVDADEDRDEANSYVVLWFSQGKVKLQQQEWSRLDVIDVLGSLLLTMGEGDIVAVRYGVQADPNSYGVGQPAPDTPELGSAE